MRDPAIRPYAQPEPLCTIEEVADHLRCTPAAVAAWRRQGLPAVKVGRLTRYRLSEVEEWFAAGRPRQASGSAPRPGA